MTARIPHALEPYLQVPQKRSLTVLTSILGASVNWLVLRFVHVALRNGNYHRTNLMEGDEQKSPEDYRVVLVSFLRDWSFWKENAARLGLDFELLSSQHRLRYIDGVTSLFKPPNAKGEPQKKKLECPNYLQEPDLEAIQSQIISNISVLKEKSQGSAKIVLILDNVDLLLATLPSLDIFGLSAMLLSLRENAHCMLLSLAADAPLMQQQSTPLESQHSSLVIGLAHQAELLMSARALSSGVAAEVSGVLRVKSDTGQGEWLYSVGKDGAVKVWVRGE